MKTLEWVSGLGPRLRAALVVTSILLLVIFVYPFKTTIVPAWSLTVINEAGTPVREINVTEHWQHYLLESSGHEDLRRIGADGRASFPSRIIRASLFRRAAATISRIAKDGRRAKRTPVASIVVWGSKDYGTAVAVYNEEEPPQSEIVVHSLR